MVYGCMGCTQNMPERKDQDEHDQWVYGGNCACYAGKEVNRYTNEWVYMWTCRVVEMWMSGS